MEVPTLSPLVLTLLGAIVFGAATVKGVAGMGFPLITVPLAANIIGPHAAVVIIAVPTVASNLFMVAQGGGDVGRLRQLGWLLAGLIGGTMAGALLLRGIHPGVLAVILGAIGVGYAGSTLLSVPLRLPASPRPALSVGVGAAAGLLGGSTTIYAPLLAGYLDSMRLTKDEFVFRVTALFLAGTAVQVLTYLQVGIYRGALLWAGILLCLPMLLGTWIGIRLRGRVSAQRFRTFVLLLILLSGLNLIVRALWR